MKEVDRLKHQLSAQEEASVHHASETCKFKAELTEMSKKLERQNSISKADKVRSLTDTEGVFSVPSMRRSVRG